jgi:hypothetical protein
MKRIILVFAFILFFSQFVSAQQQTIVTDTSQGLMNARRAILHYQFSSPEFFWVEFNNGCRINLITDLGINPPNPKRTSGAHMLKILDYMEERGFHFVGIYYQRNNQFMDAIHFEYGEYILERK